jgi:predicted nucleotidyltransferase
MIHKGRERFFRGVLENFSDLPIDKQNNFKSIKQSIEETLNDKFNIYIFGSFNHGFWDEESDYDVNLIGKSNVNLNDIISQKTNLKVNVFFTENKLGNIMIP